MGVPCDFDESNVVLSKPAGLTHDQCQPLCAMRARKPDGTPFLVSCWKLTAEELAEINRTGRVWLSIMGHTMPPACVTGDKPFEDA